MGRYFEKRDKTGSQQSQSRSRFSSPRVFCTLVGNVARCDASRHFSTLMSHSDVTIMRNDVFMLLFLANVTLTSASDTKRHRTAHTDFYVHACGTSTISVQPLPRLWPLVFSPSNLIHHKYNTNDRPTMIRPSLLLIVASASKPHPPPGQTAARRRTPTACTSVGGRLSG